MRGLEFVYYSKEHPDVRSGSFSVFSPFSDALSFRLLRDCQIFFRLCSDLPCGCRAPLTDEYSVMQHCHAVSFRENHDCRAWVLGPHYLREFRLVEVDHVSEALLFEGYPRHVEEFLVLFGVYRIFREAHYLLGSNNFTRTLRLSKPGVSAVLHQPHLFLYQPSVHSELGGDLRIFEVLAYAFEDHQQAILQVRL